MNYSSRFFLYAPLAMLLAMAAFAGTYWWTMARAIDAKLSAMKGHEAVPGVTLDWSGVTLSGFPFRLDIVFDGLSVKGAGAHGPFAWTTEHFAVHALTYGAQKDVFEAAGTQHLEWTDGFKEARSLVFLPASLHASAVRDAKGLSRFDVDIIDLAGKDFTAGRIQFHMRRDPDGKSIDLMAEAVGMKGNLGIFGSELRNLEVYQTVPLSAPLTLLLKGESSPPAVDAAWHAADGGSVTTIKTLNLDGKKNPPSDNLTLAVSGLFSPLY